MELDPSLREFWLSIVNIISDHEKYHVTRRCKRPARGYVSCITPLNILENTSIWTQLCPDFFKTEAAAEATEATNTQSNDTIQLGEDGMTKKHPKRKKKT